MFDDRCAEIKPSMEEQKKGKARPAAMATTRDAAGIRPLSGREFLGIAGEEKRRFWHSKVAHRRADDAVDAQRSWVIK